MKYENIMKMSQDLIVYSRDNLPKIKDGAYIINLDEHYDIGTHWVALWVNNNNVTYFDNFGIEHMSKEIKEFVKKKHNKKHFQNTSIWFNNVWIFLYLIYWLYVSR